jgi:hypothetical protein
MNNDQGKTITTQGKKKYERPEITDIVFNTQSTTVLGNCTGWKGALMN